MSVVRINAATRAAFDKLGAYFIHDGGGFINPDSQFFPPFQTTGINSFDALSIGAFSYSMSGFGSIASVGRYCSIAANVVANPGEHPTDWLSSSLFLFNDSWEMFGKYARDFNPKETTFSIKPFQNWKPVAIGNDVWVGEGAFILGGISIGDGAIVAGRSVVTKDVPPYAIVAGSPARIVRYRFSEDQIARLQALRWWQYDVRDLGAIDFDNIERALDQIEGKISSGDILPYEPEPISGGKLIEVASSAG